MKTWCKVAIIIMAIIAYAIIGVNGTDEAGADNTVYDAAYDQYVAEYGEVAGSYLFSKDQQ
jgi:hypothetical protein